MTNRKAIEGSTRGATTWCGMYALALVSGLEYEVVYKKMLRGINSVRHKWAKRKYITGVHNRDMERTAKTVKTPFVFKRAERMTLSQYIDHLDPNKVYIIEITGHYVVVDTRTWELCDNQSKSWCPVGESKHKRCFVREIAEVRNHKL